MTGAIICPWQSEPKRSERHGWAGLSNFTHETGNLETGSWGHKGRSPQRSHAFNTSIQSHKYCRARVLQEARAWLQTGSGGERHSSSFQELTRSFLSGPRGSGSKGQLGLRGGRENVQLKNKNQDKCGGRGVLKFGWNLFSLPSLLPSPFSSRW